MDFSRLLPVTVQAKICSDLFFDVGGSNRPAAENSSATPIEPKFDIVQREARARTKTLRIFRAKN